MAVIFHESSLSDPAPAITQAVWDKALHFSGYAVLGFLLARAFRSEGLSWATAAVGAIVVTSLYGVSDELHQMFTPLREADVRDWMADTLGGLVGAGVHILASKFLSTA
jgi:VanZ family protein